MKRTAFALFLVFLSVCGAFSQALTNPRLMTLTASAQDADILPLWKVGGAENNTTKRATISQIRQILRSQITDSTTIGRALMGVGSESAIRFIRINADNTVTLLDAASFLAALGPVTLGSGTDGNYAAGDAEAGAALTGDSATAFFAAGQIERARGGTAADTSAYGVGLLGSDVTNNTVDVDTMDELETAIGGANIIQSTELDTLSELNNLVGDADLVPDVRSITINGTSNEITSSAGAQNFIADRTWTISLPSTIDLGGKTSLKIPNGAAPVVDSFGKLAGDNNLWATGRGAPVFYDGTEAVALIGTLVTDVPTDLQVPTYHASTGTITWDNAPGSAGGDSVSVDGSATVDPNFDDGGDIDFTYSTPNITGVVKANSVALGSDTTGSYAAGDAEAGAALTGDSATAFFSTGTLESARVPLPRSYLAGLVLSNNGTDATNDIDIAAGTCRDSTDVQNITLAGALTKRLDAAWAVGTNQGGLDTGTIADTTYHVWLIKRSDTGVVDALFSTSATTPTMPTNYDYKRRIGSIIRASAAIVLFFQDGDIFLRATGIADYSSTSARAKALLTVSVPTGVNVFAILGGLVVQNTVGDAEVFVSSGSGATSIAIRLCRSRVANQSETGSTDKCLTNTSAQINLEVTIGSGTLTSGVLTTYGWIDPRGRNN